MGMLTTITLMEQEIAERKTAETAEPVAEELPFSEPEEPVEEPVEKKPVRKTAATTKSRRRTVK